MRVTQKRMNCFFISQFLVESVMRVSFFRLLILMLTAVHSMHIYQVRPRKDHRSVDLIPHALPFARLCFTGSR